MENYTGKRLDGRYEIQEIIGVGGMAVVYKAYDNIDDRIVAVKILKDEYLAKEDFRRRFKNESKAVAMLSHPNIVKVYDVSYGDRLQYIVMEYIEGITLKEYIQQQGVINSKEAVFFVMQILRALQHAHDKGIIHRDIKPQNILLLQNGAIKVTDFGIARFSASETKTMTDSTIGSVHYISPEQARGDITDDKADIYSVGVMFYEMLTGKLPFESDNTVSVAIMQLQQDPVMPREINPEIPVGLEQIVIKAMQKNLNDRYQSAAEMLLDIEEFKRNPSIRFDFNYSNTEPTKYIPTITPKKVDSEFSSDDDDEPVVKNRTIPILLGVIVALIVVLGIGFAALFNSGALSAEGKKIKVPNFVGKTYDEEQFLKDYEQFNFEITEKVDPEAKPNEILSQDPKDGEKLTEKNNKISLVVAVNSEMVEVPRDLVGDAYVNVTAKLTEAGFQIREKAVNSADYSGEIEAGTVMKVTPSEGTKVSVNSVVTVEYISYEEAETELRLVPNVAGLSEADSKKVLTSAGFTASTSYEYSNSVKKGFVISNTLVNQRIPVGSKVVIVISKGELIEQSTIVHVTLPSTGSTGTVSATLDGSNVLSTTETLDGSDYSISVTGSEPVSVFKVFVNGKLIYKCNINFTSSPCTTSNSSTYEYEEDTTTDESTEPRQLIVPRVVGMTESQAVLTFQLAGFRGDINKEYKEESEENIGKVISQFPSGFTPTTFDSSITITIGIPPQTSTESGETEN